MLPIQYTNDVVKFVKSLETKPARQIYDKIIGLGSVAIKVVLPRL